MKPLCHFCGVAFSLLIIGCSEAASADSGIPLDEAGVEPGQIFPSRLSEMEADCSYPAIKKPVLLDEFAREWYSKHLGAAGEPPLPAVAEGNPTALQLRFTWLPSFDPPVVIRINTTAEGERKLSATRLSGAGGYSPGEVADQIERTLTADEALRVDGFIERSRLLEEPANTCELGLDGSRWIVEAVEGGSYHFIDRWSPDEGAVHEFGLMMLELSGFDFDSEDVY